MKFHPARNADDESAEQHVTDRGEKWTPRLWCSFLSMVAALELLSCSYVMISIALPDISSHFSTNQGVWVLTSFLLIGTVASPLLGKLADTHGKRRILVLSVALSAVGSLVAALAPAFGVLVFGWALAGLLSPCLFLVYSLIRDVYPERSVAMAVSISTTGMGLVTIPAPVLGGMLIEAFGFRGIFWFCAVVLVVLAALIRVTTDESPVRLTSRIDLLGAVLLGSGLAGILIAVSLGPEWGWSSASTIGCAILGAGLTVAWLVSARLVRDPIIDLRVLAERTVAFTTLSSGLCWALVATFSVLTPMMVMTPDDLGLEYGLGAGSVGYAVVQVPVGLSMLLGGYAVGSLVRRRTTSRTMMVTGMLLASAGCLLMGVLHTGLAPVALFATLISFGCGIGYAATPNLLIESVPARLQATAGGIASTSGNIFPAILPVLVFAVLNDSHIAKVVDGTTYYSDTGITTAFVICGAVGLAGVLLALALPRRTTEKTEDPASPQGITPVTP
ncbi:MFS transporter [Actinomadura sp. CNU-125]|uniref:MFS transporter n=1 Tax=Actinomadura sp. CNU-125 TaxID=1904961 RepID=UPI0009671AD8|nr:MFS transporter [Actinomadura sp. CNU-125]OLT23230.1 MFS transporter [Actinomadura sp. CNU-125]